MPIAARPDDASPMPRAALTLFVAAVVALAQAGAHAATDKLLLTGGVTSIDGAAGGGLTPWAVIGSNATEGEWGVAATGSVALVRNYTMQVRGLMLAQQFCVVSGGGCTYTGLPMKKAHENIDVAKGDFNALVEVLQASMSARGVPFSTQNQLLARLAPMHREIVNVH